MKLIQDPGDPAARNYPILSSDEYREGWERIFGARNEPDVSRETEDDDDA